MGTLSEFFLSQCIIHQTSCIVTLQHNGRVARKHQHILNVTRALHFEASLSLIFWGECVLAAMYLINHTPSSVLGGHTPFEALFGRAPKYSHIKVFGCLGNAKRQGVGRDKFGEWAEKCIFVNYPYGKKG